MTLERHHRILIGLTIAVLILLGRIFYIQIIDWRYRKSAENQTKIYIPTYPSRGIIYDRNGQILVENKVSYDIMVTPRELYHQEFDTLALTRVLNLDSLYVRQKFAWYRSHKSSIGWQQQVFLRHVPTEQYMKFAEIKFLFPHFTGIARSSREYPVNAGGNLLGYCSEVDEEYMKRHPGEYSPGDFAGRTGIEAAMEKELRGSKGFHIMVRGSNNRIKGSYMDGAMDLEAQAGHNVTATIDAGLQNYGQRLMNRKVGALVAIEPSTGEILALVSSPCIDVECLADFGGHYAGIMDNPYRPLFNRAVAASYPPGSVFKLVNGLIALQEGVISPGTRFPCEKGFHYGKNNEKKVGCHSHRSPLDMNEAIMMSCNGYFCHAFKKTLENPKYKSSKKAFDKWAEYAHSFGFGEKLGSDFPSELSGNIPTSRRYDKIYRKRWNATTVISLSIGQGEIGCTPLHIANLAATIANRGYYYIPHVIKANEEISIDSKYYERHYTKVDTSWFEKIIPGMYRAVNDPHGSGSTAWSGAVEGLEICGKTGTAQNPRGDDHSVFICFAPRENPRIAVAAYIENGGFGADWAVPIASLMVEKYLRDSTSRPELEQRMLQGSLLHKVKPYKKK